MPGQIAVLILAPLPRPPHTEAGEFPPPLVVVAAKVSCHGLVPMLSAVL